MPKTSCPAKKIYYPVPKTCYQMQIFNPLFEILGLRLKRSKKIKLQNKELLINCLCTMYTLILIDTVIPKVCRNIQKNALKFSAAALTVLIIMLPWLSKNL